MKRTISIIDEGLTVSSASIVTATFRSNTLSACGLSIQNQTAKVEHVIVDGDSGAPWTDRIRGFVRPGDQFVSEPDNGIYDAINKGIRMARSEVVGVLHSDDVFASDSVVSDVLSCFRETSADVVFGDLVYTAADGRIVRTWRSIPFSPMQLTLGWMPPHPTLFVKRDVFERVCLYDTSFRIAGDYEFILRLFKTPGLTFHYLPKTITRMTLGGVSNRDLKHILLKMKEDVRAMRMHGINPWIALPAKNLRKLLQFIKPMRMRE